MSILSLLAAGALVAGTPALPSQFNDAQRYDVVTFDGGFDLAKTKGQAVVPFRGTNTACTAIVPCEQYVRAWVLCDVSADPKLDPAFAVRLLRHVHKNGGRAFDLTALSVVEMKGKTGRQLVEVPLRTGEIEAVVFSDKKGDFNDPYVKKELERQKLKNYLDLELIGRPVMIRHTHRDIRGRVDDRFTSGVRVYAVALEKPSAEMEHFWIEPGNVFHNDEKPETAVEIRVKRPGAHRLVWTIKDDEGRVLRKEERPIAKTEKLTVDLSMPEVGWYGLDWELFDGERRLLTHAASFAILGKDTRKEGQGEGPYGGDAGLYAGSAMLDGGVERDRLSAAKLLNKLGIRRNSGGAMDRKLADPYKIGTAFAADFNPASDTNSIRNTLERYLKEWPNGQKRVFVGLGIPHIYRHAEEVTGGTHDPKKGAPGAEKRVEGARRVCEFIRRNYPDFKIVLGNFHSPSEAVAELMRAGFPKDAADDMGEECMQSSNLPERLNGSSIQAIDCYRQLADIYGYKWGVTSGGWHCFRQDAVLGQDYQAWWYVRDLVLMQCWRYKDIFVGWNVDTAADYTDTVWGNSCVTRVVPYLYPKKGYVGISTATKILDQVVSRRHVPTGDPSVHVVEFAKKDGTYAYAIWAVHGAAELEIETTDDFTLVDFYGRIRSAKGASFWNFLPGSSVYGVTAGEKMTYLVSEKPVVASVKTLSRNYDHAYMAQDPKDIQVLAKTADAAQWEISNAPIACLDKLPEGETFARWRAGKGAMKAVADEAKGDVIELSIPEPDLKLPKLVSEYTMLKLKKPVALTALPNSLGVWVNGNGGMGEIYFVLEDAEGKRNISSGGVYGQFDVAGLQEINFTGWKLVTFPVTESSSVREIRDAGVELNWTTANDPKKSYKLVGLVFSAASRPLILEEHRRVEQTIRIGDVIGFDYDEMVK